MNIGPDNRSGTLYTPDKCTESETHAEEIEWELAWLLLDLLLELEAVWVRYDRVQSTIW